MRMWMVSGPGGCLATYWGIARTRKELNRSITEPLPVGCRIVRVNAEEDNMQIPSQQSQYEAAVEIREAIKEVVATLQSIREVLAELGGAVNKIAEVQASSVLKK